MYLAPSPSPFLRVYLGISATGHLDTVYALAWWPWLMWSVQRSVKRQHLGTILEVGLLSSLIFLADVRVSLFALLTAGVYALFQLRLERHWKPIRGFVFSGGMFLVLTASLIVPLVVWQPYLTRTSLSPADAGVLALQPIYLLGLILPAHRPSIETLTYFGLSTLALAGIALATLPRKYRYGLLAVTLLVALYAMGTNAFLWPLAVKLFPPLLWFRVPSRAWLILALLMPLLAGFGLQVMLSLP